ncbi:MAG: carboxylating nicotinate-nucleotide diphosphorylase [Bacteroidetes bacterium]|nr:MAG: carboxylating nicotinate-nucleotide diphosphorylase [Bacteroidota bacterium]
MKLKDIPHLERLIDQALREDVGNGDHSALCCIPKDHIGKAHLLIKESGIVAGVELAEMILHQVDNSIAVERFIEDGTAVSPGDVVFIAEGPTVSLLEAERLLLNFMQRLSGVATKTNHFVRLVDGTKAKVLDTRKTTPGLRYLEKWAVVQGGGTNHRMGLFDMIMLKDNHIDFAGGIPEAVKSATDYLKAKNLSIPIEVETRNMDEVQQVLACSGVQRVMLDNFSTELTREAVALIDGRLEVESSGGINENTIRSYAECGVDFISVGALTHSVYGLDMSFKAI